MRCVHASQRRDWRDETGGEKDDLPQPQFMVLSGFDNVMLQNEVMQSGARYYFLKPFDPEVLAERIVQLLGSASEENG